MPCSEIDCPSNQGGHCIVDNCILNDNLTNNNK